MKTLTLAHDSFFRVAHWFVLLNQSRAARRQARRQAQLEKVLGKHPMMFIASYLQMTQDSLRRRWATDSLDELADQEKLNIRYRAYYQMLNEQIEYFRNHFPDLAGKMPPALEAMSVLKAIEREGQ